MKRHVSITQRRQRSEIIKKTKDLISSSLMKNKRVQNIREISIRHYFRVSHCSKRCLLFKRKYIKSNTQNYFSFYIFSLCKLLFSCLFPSTRLFHSLTFPSYLVVIEIKLKLDNLSCTNDNVEGRQCTARFDKVVNVNNLPNNLYENIRTICSKKSNDWAKMGQKR